MAAQIKVSRYSNFNTGLMLEKISSAAEYELSLAENLSNGKSKRQIAMAGANLLDKYFGLWLDNKARRDPQSFHHVYEWNQVGSKNARLFECKITYSNDAIIEFKLTQSKEPNNDGYVFENKALTMEYGDPVTIAPNDADVLAFEIDGEMIFTPNEVHIENPGGPDVVGSFYKAFEEFMSSEAQSALTTLNFSSTIANSVKNENEKTLRKMSGKSIIIMPTTESNESAQRVVNAVEAISNDL